MNIGPIVLVSLLSCAGQLCQKQALCCPAGRHRRRHRLLWISISVVLLAAALLVWLRVLQTTAVGVAYPMLSLNFIFVTLAARWLWHEPFSPRQAAGILLIVAGVAIMGGYA